MSSSSSVISSSSLDISSSSGPSSLADTSSEAYYQHLPLLHNLHTTIKLRTSLPSQDTFFNTHTTTSAASTVGPTLSTLTSPSRAISTSDRNASTVTSNLPSTLTLQSEMAILHGLHYICCTHYDVNQDNLYLLVTNMTDIWYIQLNELDFIQHRTTVGITHISWKELFQMIKNCFDKKKGYVEVRWKHKLKLNSIQNNKKKLSAIERKTTNTTTSSSDTSSSDIGLEVVFRYNIVKDVELEGTFFLTSLPNQHPLLLHSSWNMEDMLITQDKLNMDEIKRKHLYIWNILYHIIDSTKVEHLQSLKTKG